MEWKTMECNCKKCWWMVAVMVLFLLGLVSASPQQATHNNRELHIRTPTLFDELSHAERSFCRDGVKIYLNCTFWFSSIVVNTKHIHQTNTSYEMNRGFFKVPSCPVRPGVVLNDSSLYIAHWFRATKFSVSPVHRDQPPSPASETLTIAITRYEHLNIYWTIMDIYDVFLTMRFFNGAPEETHVLLIDYHPPSEVDTLWKTLYGNITQVVALPTRSVFNNLVWTFPRTVSPMLQQTDSIPLQSQFRHFLLASFDLSTHYTTRCNRNNDYNVLFVLRHDYKPTSLGKTKHVTRKISNEQAILNATRQLLPNANVQGVQMDEYSMYTQLSLISTTDVLIGMHGAALAYAMLLPKHAAVIELFPLTQIENWHMEYIAKWNSVYHRKWQNLDPANEDFAQHSTIIPIRTVSELVLDAIDHICRIR